MLCENEPGGFADKFCLPYFAIKPSLCTPVPRPELWWTKSQEARCAPQAVFPLLFLFTRLLCKPFSKQSLFPREICFFKSHIITYIVCRARFDNFKTSVRFHYSVTMTTDAKQLFVSAPL